MIITAAEGYYIPSFYSINIDSVRNIQECIKDNEQTFVHEYIHFLQDLSLPYSIRNTLVSNRYFLLAHQKIHEQGYLQRPADIQDEDTLVTDKQFSFIWGGRDFIDDEIKISSIGTEYFQMDLEDNKARIFKYTLQLENGVTYHFGARDLLEYIAHKIENKHWNTNAPAFPYKTVDMVFQAIGLGTVSDTVRVCFAEFCLYNDNPVHHFFRTIDDLQKAQLLDALLDYEATKKVLSSMQWVAVGGFKETTETKTARRLKDLKESLRQKYNTPNLPSVIEWIDDIVLFSEKELASSFIFSELFNMSEKDFFDKINFFIKEIGVPIVFNANDEYLSLLPEKYNQDEFFNIFISLKFLTYIEQAENKACPLFNFCKKNMSTDQIIMNQHCSNDPIKKLNEEYSCPFTIFLKLYGFDKIEWN
ncbi:hypothetical protein WKS79_003095 [Providencia stuartii]